MIRFLVIRLLLAVLIVYVVFFLIPALLRKKEQHTNKGKIIDELERTKYDKNEWEKIKKRLKD
jgi:hypothetical protein